jgi:hypothetical protein
VRREAENPFPVRPEQGTLPLLPSESRSGISSVRRVATVRGSSALWVLPRPYLIVFFASYLPRTSPSLGAILFTTAWQTKTSLVKGGNDAGQTVELSKKSRTYLRHILDDGSVPVRPTTRMLCLGGRSSNRQYLRKRVALDIIRAAAVAVAALASASI